MCSPELMGAAGAGGAAAKQVEAYGNWKAQRDLRSENLTRAGTMAKQDLFQGWSDLAVRRAQHLQQTSQEIQQISDRAAMMSSTAVVGAAESGIGGNALGKLLGDYQRTSLIEQDRRLIEQDYYDRELMEEATRMRSQAQGRIYGAFTQAGPPSMPFNWMNSIQAVMGGGLGGFTQGGGQLFSSDPGGGAASSAATASGDASFGGGTYQGTTGVDLPNYSDAGLFGMGAVA